MNDELIIHVCERCLTPSDSPEACRYCGGSKVGCKVGAADDPIRRPLIDKDGHVVTRAPLWWLKKTVPELID